jgi:hypothetical protein
MKKKENSSRRRPRVYDPAIVGMPVADIMDKYFKAR